MPGEGESRLRVRPGPASTHYGEETCSLCYDHACSCIQQCTREDSLLPYSLLLHAPMRSRKETRTCPDHPCLCSSVCSILVPASPILQPTIYFWAGERREWLRMPFPCHEESVVQYDRIPIFNVRAQSLIPILTLATCNNSPSQPSECLSNVIFGRSLGPSWAPPRA